VPIIARFRPFHCRAAQLVVAAAASILAAGQEHSYPTTLLTTSDGVMLVHNLNGVYFTLEMKGRDVRTFRPSGRSPQRIMFQIGKRAVQIHTTKIGAFLDGTEKPSAREILEKYRDWEAEFAAKALGAKLEITANFVGLENGGEALEWSFPMPEGQSGGFKYQLYLTTVTGGSVLLLNCGVTGDDSVGAATEYLRQSLSTLKLSDQPIDPAAIQKTLRNGQ